MKYSKLPRPPKSACQLARNLRNNMTESEWKLWGHIRRKQLGVRFKRQVPIGNYIVDFFALEIGLVVEVDGSQHFSEKGEQKDKIRSNFLQDYGIKIARYANLEIFENIDGVVKDLVQIVNNMRTNEKSSPKLGRI
ncbi:MAG: DUF559 domain-containing protein [Planctomycetia bacterium]|nr:DUF559 domain-containing protein [Planctomycetia bacterium]